MSKLYPREVEEFITANVKGTLAVDLRDMVNKKFGTNYTVDQLVRFKKNRKLKSGIDSKFKKGNVPKNKWETGIYNAGSKKTWFKKGHRPLNYKPIGSERVSKGYILIKTSEPDKWEFKHKVIWKQHNGEIPKGHRLIFLDGDTNNCDISNLALVTNREALIMNRQGLRYNDKELTESGIMIAKVMQAKVDAKKKHKK